MTSEALQDSLTTVLSHELACLRVTKAIFPMIINTYLKKPTQLVML